MMSESQEPFSPRRPKRDPRRDFRARSHASAHAEHQEKPPQVIPDHPLIPKEPAVLLSTAGELEELVSHVRSAGSFAYDSEFIGELSYHPKLCLIQVATTQRIGLIDTLAGLDLTPFWQVLSDASIEKIVHAGEQDLEPVYRHLAQSAANVFDTQIGAGFVGMAYPAGLSKLVKEFLGVALGKGFTFTHWDQRPLTGVQLRYAADDVRYLPALRAEIGQRIDGAGYVRWAREECEALCDPGRYESNPSTDYLRLRGANSLAPQQAAVLRELYSWRESAARASDTPPRAFLRDELLIEMSRHPPRNVGALEKVRGLPRPVELAEGQNIVDAVQRGLALPESARPVIVSTEETPADRFVSDALWASVQAWCHGRGIDTALVASRQEVSRHYRELKSGSRANTRISSGWRQELLGRFFGQFIAGDAAVRLAWVDGRLESRILDPSAG